MLPMAGTRASSLRVALPRLLLPRREGPAMGTSLDELDLRVATG